MVSTSNMKNIALQMSRLKSVVFFFLFVKNTTWPFRCLLKKYSQLSVTVRFSCSLIYAIQFLGRIFEFSSQTINEIN